MMSVSLQEIVTTTAIQEQRTQVFALESFLCEFQGQFNEEDKNLLDLGIGEGYLVLPLLPKGWNLTGYEHSSQSLQYLNTHFNPEIANGTLTVKDRNLNQMDDELIADIQRCRNITMINVAPFLEDAALTKLLFTLIDEAQSGTVFLFICAFMPRMKNLEQSRKFHALPQNFVASFFAPRTNMEFLEHKCQHFEAVNVHNDALVVKKS
jgi:16S rRNA A1518/A1519 N6-dimethyltransferase RsmA/KsgA/DIM1 with predicted DNA glycosylase/AP lyase activity